MASREAEMMTVSIAGETGAEMVECIMEFAFPATFAVLAEGEWELDPAQLEAGLRDDAMRLVEYTWRESNVHRSDDPDAQLAAQMDASVRWVKNQRERVTGAEAAGSEDLNELDDLDELTPGEEIVMLLEDASMEWIETEDPDALRDSLLEALKRLDDIESE
jgi:hypothetical protein